MRAFDRAEWEAQVRRIFGKTADEIIAIEDRVHKNDPARHAARLDRIIGRWDDILAIIREELPDLAAPPPPGARKLKIGKDKDGATIKSLLLSFDPQHMTFSYAKRKEPAQMPGQGAPLFDLDDDEGGDNPFESLPL